MSSPAPSTFLLSCLLLLQTTALQPSVKGTSIVQSSGESTTAAVQLIMPKENENGERSTSLTFGGDDVLLSSTAGASLLTASSSSAVNHPTTTTATPPTSVNHANASTPITPSAHKNGNNCYFPSEYQGVYQVQSSIDPFGRVQYDQVEIGPQDISVWGTCHALFGQHVLTHTSTDNGNCFRCFHVQLRTASILQVNTEGLEKCYTKEEVARSKCPVSASIRPGDGIFLWRKSGSIDGASASTPGQNIDRSLCPLDGEFTFTYYLNGSPLCETGSSPSGNLHSPNSPASERIISTGNAASNEPNDLEHQPLSTISNCPSRDILHATFRSCSFTDRETTFKCLGTWPGENGQMFIGLMDFYDDSYAKYRCALYKEDKVETMVNGVLTTNSTFFVSLSPDSTCSTELYNATYGFETLQLHPVSKFDKEKIKNRIRNMKRKLTMENLIAAGGEDHDAAGKPIGRMPFAGGLGRSTKRILGIDTMESSQENVTCQFPEWMQGDWQYFSVKTDDIYMKDLPADFMLFDGFPMAKQQQLCVGRDVRTPGQDEKILLYSQTSCGEEYVSCMWVRKKNSAMMEFRRGISVPIHDVALLKRDSEQPSMFPPLHICEDSFFHEAPWMTQISLEKKDILAQKNATCPFFGELEAQLGRGEKCAAFSSHCGSPDVFEYKIRSCKTSKNPSDRHKQFLTYDERHYRCVSAWTDKGYTIFMTERLQGEQVNQLGIPAQNGARLRTARNNSSSSATVETQCFVMKALPNESSYLVASLNSDCRNMLMEARSWADYLSENGLRFHQTANCSTTWPTKFPSAENETANELPYVSHRGGRRMQTGQTNETGENFNAISFAEMTSDSSIISRISCGNCVVIIISLLFITLIREGLFFSERL